MDLKSFEERLYREIVIAKAMEVRAVEVSIQRVILKAPLAANTNHQLTAFGGSIYSLGVLACWSLVSETLRAKNIDVNYVLIQDGSINYKHPVTADYLAESSWADPKAQNVFLATIGRRGLARVSMQAKVYVGKRVCAELSGRFVARLGGLES